MKTVFGALAVEPVTHTFFSEELGQQLTFVGQTSHFAYGYLIAYYDLGGLTYSCSVDSLGRYVYTDD